jgi:hypothetical protein
MRDDSKGWVAAEESEARLEMIGERVRSSSDGRLVPSMAEGRGFGGVKGLTTMRLTLVCMPTENLPPCMLRYYWKIIDRQGKAAVQLWPW